MGTESQKSVDILFNIYTIVYGGFDKIIHALDSDAYKVKTFPNWFMTLVSLYGLGFQLLLLALMLIAKKENLVMPFFISYSVLLVLLIIIRKSLFKAKN